MWRRAETYPVPFPVVVGLDHIPSGRRRHPFRRGDGEQASGRRQDGQFLHAGLQRRCYFEDSNVVRDGLQRGAPGRAVQGGLHRRIQS